MAPPTRMGTLVRRAWPFIAVGALAIIIAGFFISRLIQTQYLRLSHDRLEREAAVLGQVGVILFQFDDPRLWHAQARIWSQSLEARVTIIDSVGRVIMDTDWPEDSLAAYTARAEPIPLSSASGEVPWAIAYSPIWDAELISATELVVNQGKTLGAIRLAFPFTALDEQKTAVRNLFLTILVLTGLLLVTMAAWMGGRIRRPLARLAQTTARYSKGEWDARVPIDPFRASDEFSEVAHDFNRMADEVQRRFLQSRRERDQLQTVLANMSDGVLAVDSQGRVRLVNAAFLRFFRSVLAEPLGQPHAEAFRDRTLNDLVDKLLYGEAEESEELEVAIPKRRVLVVRPALIGAARGEDVRGVLVARDVTARRQLDQMRRDFVANVSHELRTPLTAILGYVSALRDGGAITPPSTTFLDTIERNAQRMNRIVGDLLDLSRIEAPGYKPALTPFSFKGLLEEVESALSPMLATKSQWLTVDVQSDADIWVADRDSIGRALSNLIENAIKYSPDDRAIAISVSREDGHLKLTVSDEGMGVPETDRARLFERFFRVDRGRSRDLGGTGLGLSIVKHIAESHGGSAQYQPNFPSGSRFLIRIPVPPDEPIQQI